jgi:hypothetical protein
MNVVLKGLLSAAVLAFAMPAWADDNCTGIDTLVATDSNLTDFGGGVKKLAWTADSIVSSSNDSTVNMLVGECSATTLITPDGKSQSQGFCARHDADGDVAVISISQAPGADKSEWKSLSGTGKFANRQESGWSQRVLVSGNVFIVKWGGTCQK